LAWNFDNSYARELEGLYAPWQLDPPVDPQLVAFNAPLAERLGLPLRDASETQIAALIGGAEAPEGAEPVAMAYSGHQFGHFSHSLGDGRALLLGEVIAPDGKRFDLQLKGSGRTPFSRGGDGKLVLGPGLREFLMSEAIAALGISTMRTLGVVTTGEKVMRDGHKPGAVLLRTGASHLRVGSFEYAAAHHGAEMVRKLADYSIARHHPEAARAENPYLALMEAVMDAQIALVASWMNVGFIHGVMNTDNVTISGETIDYGPCAFMDRYSATTVFSSIDKGGRYAFANQPNICRWNMAKLGSALAEVIVEQDEDGIAKANALLEAYPDRYHAKWLEGMRAKLGLATNDERDLGLVASLFNAMEGQGADFRLFFRKLSRVPEDGRDAVTALFDDPAAICGWLDTWEARIAREGRPDAERAAAMDAMNPLYIPRNHLVEAALEAAEGGDLAPFEKLLEVVRQPFSERDGLAEYTQPAPADTRPYVTYCGT